MTQYIVKRCLAFPIVLLFVSLFIFGVMRVLPGDIAYAVLGPFAGKQEVAALHKTGRSTAAQIRSRLPVTAEIALVSLTIGAVWGAFWGAVAATTRGSRLDGAIRIIAVLGLAVPGFWLAVLAIVLPSVLFNWTAPVQYASPFHNLSTHVQQVIFPIMILSFASSAPVARLTRATMLGVLRSDYITTARSKGLTTATVVRRHALKNSLIPVVTVVGNQLGGLLAGSVIIETTFGLPGVGKLTYDSIVTRDLTQVQANVMFFASVFLVLNLLVDLSYSWLDPRIHFG